VGGKYPPIMPEKFKTKPIEKVKKLFNEPRKSIQCDDFDLLINGCNADRERELIFMHISELARCKNPSIRL
jgi:DNA topoisomerase-3